MDLFDLIVIGGGPAGYLAAERAGHAGLKTAVVEKRALGGVCLNEGCIPSKAFLNSAKYYEHALHGQAFGVTASDVKIDHAKVVARKNNVVKQLVSGVGMQLKRNKVTVITGEAAINGKCDEGFKVVVNGTEYAAKKLLIASGSVPVTPPIPGVKEGLASGFVMTNREILDMTEVPQNLVIIGGGVIGLEMASYFNSIGSKVTVIEMLNKIAGPTDAEISKILLKNYQAKGVDFKLSCKVVGVGTNDVSYEENGEVKSVKADKVLLSIGRRAFTQNLGLETIGVYTERGAIVTDDNMRTNIPGVYAAGDVNGKSMLAHTAYREAEVAVNHMIGKKDVMRYSAIPAVIYTNPEVASVGETEDTAKAKGIDVKVANVTMKFSGRYVAENENGDGICKLIVDKKYNRLIGVHLIGSYASEMIYGAALMIETELDIENIKELVFPHPTVCEVIREALFEL
ncbi:MAG: dihydrolipoyl dehydrogenase [Oscillospiraceae bacterium]|nr:dihydrolipoyl dehydrogenase [Oscillospiraceae bacterium]